MTCVGRACNVAITTFQRSDLLFLSFQECTMSKKNILKIEDPQVRAEIDASVHKVVYDPYLLMEIFKNVTSMEDRNNVELTCSFFKDVSRGTQFQSSYFKNAIECFFMHLDEKMTCQGPGDKPHMMPVATLEKTKNATKQPLPEDLQKLRHFFHRFSRHTMSVTIGGTPAELAIYCPNHTLILTRDLIECFAELNHLKHISFRSLFVERDAADFLRGNLILKNRLVALCFHDVHYNNVDLHKITSLASGPYVKHLTFDSVPMFCKLMRDLDRNKSDIHYESVSIYTRGNTHHFFQDIENVAEIAVKHVRFFKISANFYNAHWRGQFKSLKEFLDNTKLNIETLDVRISSFAGGNCDNPSQFELEDLFKGLSRQHSLKRLYLSGKMGERYEPVILNLVHAISKLESLNSVVFNQMLKNVDESFWDCAVQALPTSLENLAISSVYSFRDRHAQILAQRLTRLKKLQISSAKVTSAGAERILAMPSLTHVELTRMPALGRSLGEVLENCSKEFKAIIAGMTQNQMAKEAREMLESQYPFFKYVERRDEKKFQYEIAKSEDEVKALKDIGKFFYCDQCNVDVLTDQVC
ncbi:hypothetical protein L596_028273 [Steinernema carpocapsae]|uniref:Uncharacterized protein n=1 Tax=Steinernema carpocapsae TaxID=34508 RepID=A0A4U5LY01_STECR|nr:hypothetical protein L596_028273 [Steinernema carpocapsae]